MALGRPAHSSAKGASTGAIVLILNGYIIFIVKAVMRFFVTV